LLVVYDKDSLLCLVVSFSNTEAHSASVVGFAQINSKSHAWIWMKLSGLTDLRQITFWEPHPGNGSVDKFLIPVHACTVWLKLTKFSTVNEWGKTDIEVMDGHVQPGNCGRIDRPLYKVCTLIVFFWFYLFIS